MYKIRFYCIDGVHHVYVEQAIIDPNVTCPTHPTSEIKDFVVLKSDISVHHINEDTYLDKDGDNEVAATDAKDAVAKKHIQDTDTAFIRRDGSVPLLADWDIGGPRKILASLISARDAMGLRLFDYTTGAGIWIADGGNVGIGGAADSKAVLTLSSTTKGFLPPRMTDTQRDAIVSPPTGLMLYDITNDKHDFYDGSVWKAFVSTDISTFVVGSVPFATDTHHISDDNANFFWNNTLKRLGIGTNTPNATLNIESASGALTAGYGCTATSLGAVAFGYETNATGMYATSMGAQTTASNQSSVAMGFQSTASGLYSVVMGRELEAGGNYVVAIGLDDMNGLVCSQANSMCIMGGNVGINDSTPDERLSVNGNIKVTGTVDGVDIATHEHSDGSGETRLIAKDRRQFATGEKHIADSGSGDTLSEHMILQAQDALTVTKIFFLPDAALTANDIDYARITVYRRDSSGGTKSMMATVESITGDSGNWTAFDAVDFGAIAMPPQNKVATGEVLTWEITKFGSGVIVPSGTLQIEYTID